MRQDVVGVGELWSFISSSPGSIPSARLRDPIIIAAAAAVALLPTFHDMRQEERKEGRKERRRE